MIVLILQRVYCFCYCFVIAIFFCTSVRPCGEQNFFLPKIAVNYSFYRKLNIIAQLKIFNIKKNISHNWFRLFNSIFLKSNTCKHQACTTRINCTFVLAKWLEITSYQEQIVKYAGCNILQKHKHLKIFV